jgi:hypothetical protein
LETVGKWDLEKEGHGDKGKMELVYEMDIVI